jgi:hypothetical protein
MFKKILPVLIEITVDVSILSLSVIRLFSLKSFVFYIGDAVTAVVKQQ